ncbi:UNVERIFIED_CONTAM: hypothetical protein Slati_2903900 [Sesamum latifolium]|uniref:Integrase catalytic domain-containing protein n=1 Tax=Sesamum latifolium TaxID=2727402 RepID=A0AAW2VG50_9LAMI
MLKDASALVRKCSPCQKHANHLHNPVTFMKTLESPCPFHMWGMDIVGKLPRATGQKEYLIVAVDYFTKWVEAEPLAKIGEKEVIKFIWQNIIYPFSIPRVLIADNGTQFQGGKLKSWLEELKIKQLFTLVNNPQANGQAEETPFNLVYETEVVLPAEIGEETWRVRSYDNTRNSKSRRDLDLVEEKREMTERRIRIYKNKIARDYDDKVRPESSKKEIWFCEKQKAHDP